MIAGVDHKDCLRLRIPPSLPSFISSIISMHLYPFLPFCLPQECISMISFECIRDPDGLFLPIRKHPKLLLLHLHRLLVLPHLLLLLIKIPQKKISSLHHLQVHNVHCRWTFFLSLDLHRCIRRVSTKTFNKLQRQTNVWKLKHTDYPIGINRQQNSCKISILSFDPLSSWEQD